jgi:hypothetical protein
VPAIQYWFTGGAVATFLALLGAVSTLGYAWYRAAVTEMESASSKAASAAQKLKADRVKGLLAKALVSGDKLIGSHKDTDEDQAKKDAEKWGQQIHDLIAAAYGEGRPPCSWMTQDMSFTACRSQRTQFGTGSTVA